MDGSSGHRPKDRAVSGLRLATFTSTWRVWSNGSNMLQRLPSFASFLLSPSRSEAPDFARRNSLSRLPVVAPGRPGAASCRATFENWAAEQRAECLCASWLVQLQRSPLYSGTQDICTRIHRDTRLWLYSEVKVARGNVWKCFFRKNTLRMVSCAKACAKQWNCKCIQCILRVCFRIFDLGATNLTAQSRSSKGNWFQMKKLQLFEQGW